MAIMSPVTVGGLLGRYRLIIGVPLLREKKDRLKMGYQGSKGDEYALAANYLEQWGFPLSTCSCLDMFARDGSFRSVDIVSKVGKLEAWDIEGVHLFYYGKNFPNAKVYVTDSVFSIQLCAENPGRKWDLIIADHSLRPYGPHHEHFNFLRRAFECLTGTGKSAIIFNATSEPLMKINRSIDARKRFYGKSYKDYMSTEDLLDFYINFFGVEREKTSVAIIPQAKAKYYIMLFMFDRKEK
jgi:hypothetical protein